MSNNIQQQPNSAKYIFYEQQRNTQQKKRDCET